MRENETVTVNGKVHPYQQGMTVASLLAGLVDTPGSVVVEVNAAIIPRGTFDATPLHAGDTVEIVHFVGGG